jgi:hypothetical protein
MMAIPAILQREVSELLAFLAHPKRNDPEQYEVIKTRLDCTRFVTQIVERQGANAADLRGWQEWFRAETDPYFSLSNTCKRARVWPEGFPGSFRTLKPSTITDSPIGTIFCKDQKMIFAAFSKKPAWLMTPFPWKGMSRG